jgi:transcriptional regulator with XRE-family HTH domain
MNDVQELIAQLREKGWTISAIADAMSVSRDAVDFWRAGSRYPSNALPVKHELERLLAKKRIPKRKRYKV